MASAVTVNIKMYRVGELGDCFLLRFTNGNEKTHVLIDCGSFSNKKTSIARMQVIAADIQKQLAGAKLDVIVGTHQHNDHLSGFVHAKDIFESIAPEQVWLSWLDNPNDDQARAIGKEYNNYLTSLRLINKELKTAKFNKHPAQQKVADLLGFFGVSEETERLDAKTDKLPPNLPSKARDVLQSLGKKKPAYLSPGHILNLPGISGGAVKVYVLGPPKSVEMLYDKEPRKDETFDPKLSVKSLNASKLLYAMKNFGGNANPKIDEEPFPFDEPSRNSKNYDAVLKSYNSRYNSWRKIDLDWVNQAEQLALWLDGFTNNSSLVLAFELASSSKVLLFAADAQAGNWNSWKTVKWKKAPAGFNWLNLMQNTVLYKTGHHGSHNSTLVEGLDNMTHKDLVVMIPVDKTDSHISKQGWKMPAVNLYKELKIRSQNRILLMDDGISTPATLWKNLVKPKETDLYIEYEVRDS